MFEETRTRKVPVQARSRERQDHILQVAERLIADKGSEAMNMSELASTAGISIGSLYQYYRDKGAILAALAERYHAASTACIETELAEARDPAALQLAFDRLGWIYFELFKTNPAMRDVWTAIQSDKSLRAIEHEANTRNGALLAAAIRRSAATVPEDCDITAFTVMALGEASMRLAMTQPPAEAVEVVRCYLRASSAELDRCTRGH